MKSAVQSPKYKIVIGGWYQRTTLHLTEIYDLFSSGLSVLDLDKSKLKEFYNKFNFESVERTAGFLETIKTVTKNGISINYHEDGLYALSMESDDVLGAERKLKAYYEEILNPAISYIFSKGAPTPKVLANIKTIHPAGIGIVTDEPMEYTVDEEKFGKAYSKIESEGIVVYKTPLYVFVASKPELEEKITELLEMQIFFREFKDQLQKYLNIHRNVWEEISKIKERKKIKGREVNKLRSRLDDYQTSISLIKNRTNQMGLYVDTRSSIAKKMGIESGLADLFEYKFEVLSDSLAYIKEIWEMTSEYLSSAIQNIVEIKQQSTANGVESLQLITSIGVLSSIIGYLTINNLPAFTLKGVIYFGAIIIATIILNIIVIRIYRDRSYKLDFGDRAENL